MQSEFIYIFAKYNNRKQSSFANKNEYVFVLLFPC